MTAVLIALWALAALIWIVWPWVKRVSRRVDRLADPTPLAYEIDPEYATPEEVLERLDSLRARLAELSPRERECARNQLFGQWADRHPFVQRPSQPIARCVKRGEQS